MFAPFSYAHLVMPPPLAACRALLPASAPRTRVDAGTWGTMGVGLGAAIAAAALEQQGASNDSSSSSNSTTSDSTACSSSVSGRQQRVVFAVEGDSAFGFSGMELET